MSTVRVSYGTRTMYIPIQTNQTGDDLIKEARRRFKISESTSLVLSSVTDKDGEIELYGPDPFGTETFDEKPRANLVEEKTEEPILSIQIRYFTSSNARSGIKVPSSLSLADLCTSLTKHQNLDPGSHIALLWTNHHLFAAADCTTITVGQVYDPTNILFVHFLPIALKDKAYYLHDTRSSIWSECPYWKEVEPKQTPLSLSTLLASMVALRAIDLAGIDVTFFLLRNMRKMFSFSPAVLALKHILLLQCHNFEKHVLVTTLIHYFRALLPTQPTDSLLTITPRMWVHLTGDIDPGNNMPDFYKSIKLVSDDDRKIVSPYWIPGIGPANDGLLIDLEKQIILEEFRNIKIDPTWVENATFKLMVEDPDIPDEYLTWDGPPTCEYPESPTPLDIQQIAALDDKLLKTPQFINLVFVPPTSNHLSIHCDATGTWAVYVDGQQKNLQNSYTIFHPCNQHKSTLETSESLSEIQWNSYPKPVTEDIRPIKQLDCILLDMSGSMSAKAWNDEKTRKESAIIFLESFVDRTKSYELSHAIGLIPFGSEVEENPITRNYSEEVTRILQTTKMSGSTSLWCAIRAAANLLIKAAADLLIKQASMFKDPQPRPICRILCLTDGGSTDSNDLILPITMLCKQHGIILDSVQIDGEQKKLKGMVHCLGGSVFLPSGIHEATSLFEEETVLDVGSRNMYSPPQFNSLQDIIAQAGSCPCGVPERKLPPQIKLEAKKHSPEIPPTLGGTRRILQEFKELCESEYHVFMNEQDLRFWKLVLEAPSAGSPYSGGKFVLYLKFPETYPNIPPEIRFVTPIYHCNVSSTGKICHQILSVQRGYSPHHSL